MKVNTDISAGSLLEDAIQSFENLSNLADGFVTTAEGQASDLATTAADVAENAWQYLVTLVTNR